MIVIRSYNRERAQQYAKTWAFSRNPLFLNYTGLGGDCTNFISQSIFAGSCEMNFTPVFGWYYISAQDRTASWTGVQYFYDFIINNVGNGPFATVVGQDEIEIGDVIQLQNEDGIFYHTLLVVGFSRSGEILVAAHSDDAYDRPLSTYTYANERFIHILGIRFDTLSDTQYCFDDLLSGSALIP